MIDEKNKISVQINQYEVVSCFDELPMWSAPFGSELLETVKFRKNINILDIGCGTGFPLLELAQRFGETCRVIGIDPWTEALERTKKKISTWDVKNVELVEGKIENNSFKDNSFQLITSNNGLNNVDDLKKSLSECRRISSDSAQLVFTMNLPETMNEFYNIYRQLLKEMNKIEELQKLEEHIFKKRKPVEYIEKLFAKTGFTVIEKKFNKFNMRYIDGTAFFNHSFIQLAFLDSWKEILQEPDRDFIFKKLESEINQISEHCNGFNLTIPFVCFDCMAG